MTQIDNEFLADVTVRCNRLCARLDTMAVYIHQLERVAHEARVLVEEPLGPHDRPSYTALIAALQELGPL